MDLRAPMAFIGYPEILLAIVCVLYLRRMSSNNGLLRNWPFFGMLPAILHNYQHIHEYLTQVLKLAGSTFIFKGPWFANMHIVFTTDPANVHYVMSSNFSKYPKGPESKKIFDVLGDSLFNLDLDSWRIQKNAFHAWINQRRFHRFLEKTNLNKVERGLVPVLEHVAKQSLVVDLQDVFQRFTFDSTCILASGSDPGCLSIDFPDAPFSKAFDDIEEALFFRHIVPESYWKLLRWLGIGEERKLSRAWETLDYFIAKLITMKREEMSKRKKMKEDHEEEERVDLLASYMVDDNYNEKFLRDNVLNFIFAGRDTTSAALTWFFWLVSKNPSVETKLLEEIKATLRVNDEEKHKLYAFNTKELRRLVYLHGALCESLRLFPPVPFQPRSPLFPDILPSGHPVDKKSKIIFSLYAMGRMEAIWGKDCLEFKPERWISPQGGIIHQPSFKFLAFNAGPRSCMGKEVAFSQMKAVAVAMINNYHIQVVEGHPVSPSTSIILHMKHGLMVRLIKRSVHE
ncbi:hypothetical protein HHK36_004125 [Tetracentron sinense]|uniref:Cytochrome P450 n=1 Tax=Tetracentron sinense TaxID=13715 RepID=A0A834ZTQ2_TETSI|nr:hypothetical protein HHK36_004125 [Tetracentron sinense]